MKKIIVSLLFLCLGAFSFAQKLQSPEQFLGYKVGTRFTPHWRIVAYFQYVAGVLPQNVVLQQYGTTQEGRPLYICYVSSADNVSNRESIRKNNLALAGILSGAASETGPTTVWLTYNVHGNEAASSEAAMLTLYALANPDDAPKQAWLKNTLVIIDPCMNPDGRDRYVNWYNTTVGKDYNPDPMAREHREPWPYGRTNHYNFDMNRDWVWQSQKETQERMAQFTQWLPQVHVDFHEQGPNGPYYFAPAAAPYHEVLTQWQRTFQDTIGRNHARYFDQNGWLFFTKEVFDLFYPSYGDTYPLYNGSIGMTYEQGGIGAGLGVKTNDEDTLRLTDRVLHHYTTGISTVETSSRHALELMKNYHAFYKKAPEVGTYKTYVIKNLPMYRERILALQELLDKNGIQYGTTSGTSVKGYNYDNGKDTTMSVSNKDIVVSAHQPKGVMVKVMFEPKTKLEDSVTYDITSWALPYVFGLPTVATTQVLGVQVNGMSDSVSNNINKGAYGYAFAWQGGNSSATAAQLLKKGIKLRYSDCPFSENGKKYDRGTMLILRKGNEKWADSLFAVCGRIATANKVQLDVLTTGMVSEGKDFGSSHIRYVKAPKVVLLTGETVGNTAAGEVWYEFEQHLDYPLTLVNVSDFGRLQLSDYDVVIMPDGYYPFLQNKELVADFTKWIERGGKVIAFESAVAQLSKIEGSALELKKDKKEDSASQKDVYANLFKYENREHDEVTKGTPGAVFKVRLDNTHPLAFGFADTYYTLKMDDNIYAFIKDKGWNVGVIKKENQLAGFVGKKLEPKLKDGLLFGVEERGRGNIVYMADNVLFRDFWENGRLMFANALFLVGD
ncbi:MAG: M14 family metallopeptidase [Chitinophagaceae bacterium]